MGKQFRIGFAVVEGGFALSMFDAFCIGHLRAFFWNGVALIGVVTLRRLVDVLS